MVIRWVLWKLHPQPSLVSAVKDKYHCILVFALFSKFTLHENEIYWEKVLLDFFWWFRINYWSRLQLMKIVSNKPQGSKLKFYFGSIKGMALNIISIKKKSFHCYR